MRFFARFLLMLLLVGLATAVRAQDDADLPPPVSVTIAGTLQPQLGCTGEWTTECEASMLVYDAANDLYIATFSLTPGFYEYKAALNGSWDDNYGLNAEYYGANIPLEVTEAGAVTFFYDHKTRWVSDSLNSPIATVPGSYQTAVGCASDWAPECLRSLLQDPDGDGIYTFITALIPAGDYEAKVALNQSWDVNYGADGVSDGANIPFTVPEGAQTTFTYDPATNLLAITTDDAPPDAITSLDDLPAQSEPPAIVPAIRKPNLVVIPGTIQSALGCPGDWQPDCEATALSFDEENQVWQATFDLPAGSYLYKAAVDGSWDVNFGQNAQQGGADIPLNLAADTAVTFLFDHVTGWVTDSVNATIATVVGDFQAAIGCASDEQPDCLRTWLQDPDGDGTFIYQTVDIPPGDYGARVAVGQSLAETYGADGAAGGTAVPFTVPEANTLVVFVWDSASKLFTVGVASDGRPPIAGNIRLATAHWVAADTIAWEVDTELPTFYRLYFGDALSVTPDGIAGGDFIELTLNDAGLDRAIEAKFPHLSSFQALKIDPADLDRVPAILRGQTAVAAGDDIGLLDAAGLQLPGVLDDLYTYEGPLGVTFAAGVPTLRVWAPTARNVHLHLYDDADPDTPAAVYPMDRADASGVWSLTGDASWNGRFYNYEVEVYAPAAGAVVVNLVTDPYAHSLSMNSQRSQIVDLNDPAYKPAGWDELIKPPPDAPEDIVVYELHMRDFSLADPAVPAEHRGTYLAFTHPDSNGMQHLAALADAGLTHLHLLPTFDITTIDENKAEWQTPDEAQLATLPPDSEEQQTLLAGVRGQDGFNWGYDPYHYTVPEGSYATDPDGPARIVEYRQMVQALADAGLYVVADVVYNHTSSAGQADTAVLDRIVPGYYHRLNAIGSVENSTCCQNTATEHNMMRKLMVDSVVTWAIQYKVDAFRFDLMGHHMVTDMQAVRDALDALTVAEHGVDGAGIYLYGEGWNFGEVADNARGENATQFNMAGTGIGTFNDRLRDAVRGGTPFGGQTEQGFINGLYTDPNTFDQGSEEAQRVRLLRLSDHLRAGLAGNLADYWLMAQNGRRTPAAGIDYNGSPTAYTADPQENIVYISKHDNETLFDIIQYKAPLDSTLDERVRMQNLGLSIVSLSQGIPFFQAGSDMLRSKSLDRNSYDSGDWFNRLDFTYETNNWGVGLPPAADNQEMWPLMEPLLAADGLTPEREHILRSVDHFREMLRIRRSSPLFRLRTADQVRERVYFHNTGPFQTPGLIVMSLFDAGEENLDEANGLVVVLFNADDEPQRYTVEGFVDLLMTLHSTQQNSTDPLVRTASFEPATGTFSVPGRTTAVFVLPEIHTPDGLLAPGAREADDATTPSPVDSVEEAAAETVEQSETIADPAPDRPSLVPLAVGAGLALGLGGAFLLWRRQAR